MDDVNELTKEEFLKFLNCADQKNLPKKFLVKDSKNRPISLVERPGIYEADNIKLKESSINKKVVRIPLPVVKNLQDLKPRQARATFRPQAAFRTYTKKQKNIRSSFGRKIVKKAFFEDKPKPKSKQLQTKKKNTFKVKFSKPTASPKPVKPKKKKDSSDTDSKTQLKSSEKTPQKNLVRKTKRMEATARLTEQNSMFSIRDEPLFFLKFNSMKYPDEGKLKYPFEVLVKDIKNMKLPSGSWKIKVIVRNSKISSIIFTNKCVLERTVTFTAKTETFSIVLENKPAILLGAPNTVDCIEDIEILLNIIHTISAKSPMVYYKS